MPPAALRPVALCALLALPAVVLRIAGAAPPAAAGLLAFGTAVVASSFLLAWTAEAARVDIAGPLAIAVLAVIAVLPEYAVDLHFAHRAGSDPGYAAYAAATMTGSNRLLLGLGWSLVVLIPLRVAARRTGRGVRELVLEPGHRVELGFLAIASVVAFAVPLSGRIHLALGLALIGLFAFYLGKVSRAGAEEPELVGPAARIGALPGRARRPLVVALFVVAAAVILASAEPFATSLVGTGRALGVDEFLLVQWLAPLVSSKVNQWTLLVGSLPVAHLLGGGGPALVLDARQVEEFLLTAAQTVLGVAALLALRFPRGLAYALLGLFALQFAVPGPQARYALCTVYAVLAVVALVRNRHHIGATFAAPFRREPRAGAPDRAPVRAGGRR